MEIRNLLEEIAAAVVQDVCNEDSASQSPRYNTSQECRLDAICYVLNRIPPRYISSGRGYAHLTEELRGDTQLQVDLVRLAHEGLQRVSAVSRAFYGTPSGSVPPGPCFNFPTIKGRVLDGNSFFPLSEITVTLRQGGTEAAMFDNRWSNPYTTSEKTRGMYNFWPASVVAEEEQATRTFDFEILLEGPGFNPVTHFFSLECTSEKAVATMVSMQRDHTLPDLYMFS
ncbi:competence protein ComFB [Alkalispirochaeta americana]|uniref:Competence protein ComFB n=1 Tax=Alkalispirochaeta americana TaxID=159291 RepID=A0A1N6NE25_9SPIO|nr:late competence development ComFB family protein [Alkalispirochaeta americana]SIP90335.1 competence protein ComFB [Alkalispirochaeta americana]